LIFVGKKLKWKKRHDQILEWGLFQATVALNANPNCSLLLKNYDNVKKGLVDSKIKKIKDKIFKNDAQYLMNGEKPVKSFFDRFKSRKEHKPIRCLKNDEGKEFFKMNCFSNS